MSTRRRMVMSGSQHVVDGIIQDSWEEIVEICNVGNAQKYYSVGDTKELDLTNDKTATMEIVGFNCVLKKNGPAVSIVWVSKELVLSGFGTSAQSEAKQVIPSWLLSLLPVLDYWTGTRSSYDSTSYKSTSVELYNFFPPLTKENFESRYSALSTAESRIKVNIDTGEPEIWRLDSSYSTSSSSRLADVVDIDGNFTKKYTNPGTRTPLCFCL